MLDTNICSFIMREQPEAVLKRLEHAQLVEAFCARLDAILPWDRRAVDATTDIKVALRLSLLGKRVAHYPFRDMRSFAHVDESVLGGQLLCSSYRAGSSTGVGSLHQWLGSV